MRMAKVPIVGNFCPPAGGAVEGDAETVHMRAVHQRSGDLS